MGPGVLAQVIAGLPVKEDANLLVGSDTSDDAGVYRLNGETALIQTVDFFTPIVDDPYLYGQIAAANALSDVYAMGGRPLTALNVVCFPTGSLDLGVLRAILRGGADKVLEAGAVLAGGHTIEDNEPKYGLAVTGVVHPQRVVANKGALPGDHLVLTKPLGTGVITTGIKRGVTPPEVADRAVAWMALLNRDASLVMQEVGVNACTDITGFGLLGHAREMAAASGAGLKLHASRVPLIEGALELASQGVLPGGARANAGFVAPWVTWEAAVPQPLRDLLCDPQTSGGLLLAVSGAKVARLVELAAARGVVAVDIGEAVAESPGCLTVTE